VVAKGRLRMKRQRARLHMPHRCTIQRGTPATDSTPKGWSSHLTGIRCRYIEQLVEERTDLGGVRFVRRSALLLPAGTDVTGRDRVQSVTNELGEAMLPRPYDISGDPINHGTHIEVTLASSSGGP
jgi:hypothetical protein